MSDFVQINIRTTLQKPTEADIQKLQNQLEKNIKPIKVKMDSDEAAQIKLYKSLQKIYKEEEKQRLLQEKFANKALSDKEKQLQYEQKVRRAIEETINKEKLKTEETKKQIALYKEELAIKLKNAQTSYGKHFTNEQKSAILSKADLIAVDTYKNGIKDTNLEYDKQISKSRELRKEATLSMKESDTFMKTFVKDLGKLAIWSAAATLLYAPLRSLKEGITYLTELDGSLNEIMIVTGKTQTEVAKLAISYNSLAKEMNVATRELAGTAADLFRQGLNNSEVEDRMKGIIQYAKISSISLKDSNRIITATANATGESVQKITDIFALLGDTTASGKNLCPTA